MVSILSSYPWKDSDQSYFPKCWISSLIFFHPSVSPAGFLFSPLFIRSASMATQSKSSSVVCKTTQSTCKRLTWRLVNWLLLESYWITKVLMRGREFGWSLAWNWPLFFESLIRRSPEKKKKKLEFASTPPTRAADRSINSVLIVA